MGPIDQGSPIKNDIPGSVLAHIRLRVPPIASASLAGGLRHRGCSCGHRFDIQQEAVRWTHAVVKVRRQVGSCTSCCGKSRRV